MNSDNPYAYNYVHDTRELVYLDGVGFLSEESDETEKKYLEKNAAIIAFSLLLFICIGFLGNILCAIIMKNLGFCTYDKILFDVAYSSDTAKSVSMLIVDTLKVLGSMLFLNAFLKLPKAVFSPFKITNKPIFKLAVPVIAIITVLAFVMNEIFSIFMNDFGINTVVNSINYPTFSISSTIIGGICSIIIFPFIFEVYLHGLIMQSLRQFGDGFALIATAAISAVLVQNFFEFFSVFCISICIGYFVLKTGSILTGIIMFGLHRAILFFTQIIRQTLPPTLSELIVYSLLFIMMVSGFVYVLNSITKRRGLIGLNISNTFLTSKQKVFSSIITFPSLAWLALSFVLTLGVLFNS